MFQGMFRKRGRPPDPPLQIGGYDNLDRQEDTQIPSHQLRDELNSPKAILKKK